MYDNFDLHSTSCEKVLDVYIDDNLTFLENHFQLVLKKDIVIPLAFVSDKIIPMCYFAMLILSFTLNIHSLGYTPFREDRGAGTVGGGVFILVKDTIIATEQKQLKTDCGIIWVKLDIVAAKPLYIAAYYRPKESDAHSLEELNRSLEMVSMRKGNIWVLGDFNFPKFSWDSEHVPTIKPGCRYPSIYNSFISCLDDYSLVQMVSKPTRGDNVLDLFLTSNHTLVNKVEILSGISDHEISISNVSIKPKMSRQKPILVPIYRKADWNKFKSFMALKSSEILCRFQESTVEEIWNALKQLLTLELSSLSPLRN